jgi:hypothetical protein
MVVSEIKEFCRNCGAAYEKVSKKAVELEEKRSKLHEVYDGPRLDDDFWGFGFPSITEKEKEAD